VRAAVMVWSGGVAGPGRRAGTRRDGLPIIRSNVSERPFFWGRAAQPGYFRMARDPGAIRKEP